MKKIFPPTLVLFCLLGMLSLHSIFPLAFFSNTVLTLLGVVLVGFGLVLAVTAEAQFRKADTTVNPFGLPARLVTDGWFKYSRNPMYLSLALMLLGAWLMLGSVSSFLGVITYLGITDRWYIAQEEKRLRSTFGSQYEAYQRLTRRWL